jgi:hypothetical protein
MRRLVVNVATGAYVAGQRRLKLALSDPSMCWADQMPPGALTHKRMPYSFKAFAVEAGRLAGADLVLWADACILPIRSMEPLWDLIESKGYWFSRNYGFKNGQWCSDAALPLLGITREEAFQQDHVVATTFGLNLRSEIGATFAAEYLRLAQNGSFRGPWTNKDGEASADPRVTGHRHDQTAASVIAARLGMVLTDPPAWFAYRGGETQETVLVADAAY